MSYPDHIQTILDEAPDSIRENLRTVETYNAGCDAARQTKLTESEKKRKEIEAESVHVANLQREQAKYGLPFKTVSGEDGKARRVEYDPTEPMVARIAVMKRERNTLENQPLPRTVELEPWVKTFRAGQRLIEAEPVKLSLRKGETLADAFDKACTMTDGTLAGYAKVQRAPVSKSEAKERARAYVARQAKAGLSVWGLLQGGEFLHSGRFAPVATRPEPDFAKFYIPMDGTDPLAIADPVKLLAAIAPNILIDALDAGIDAASDDDRAIPSSEKADRLADAAEAIVAAQRIEAAIGLECVRQRVPVVLRHQICPAVYLGCEWPASKIVDWLDH